jgi:sec-independent protein translocase protein TatB
MDFLGMGPLELIVVLILALVVLGPERLPEVAAQVGKLFRDLRRLTTELSSEFNAGMQDFQSIQAEVQGLTDDIQELRNIEVKLDQPSPLASPVSNPPTVDEVAAAVKAAAAVPSTSPAAVPPAPSDAGMVVGSCIHGIWEVRGEYLVTPHGLASGNGNITCPDEEPGPASPDVVPGPTGSLDEPGPAHANGAVNGGVVLRKDVESLETPAAVRS